MCSRGGEEMPSDRPGVKFQPGATFYPGPGVLILAGAGDFWSRFGA